MTVDAAEARRLLEAGEAVMVDVRDHMERQMAAIPGTLHIPLHELPGRIEEVPTDKTVICQCASGARSASAVGLLQRAGHPDARNLRMGIMGWQIAGLPVEGA